VNVEARLPEAIDGICRALAGDGPQAADVARGLGDVVEEQSNALRVRPRDELFSDAYVVHERGGDVAHVDLELRRPGSLDVLAAAFGEYTEPPRLHWDSPRAIIFEVEHAACAVIARVVEGSAGSTVTGVTVRRDA
jgi:hypothetical protein